MEAMRSTTDVTITGERCILVPYRREHVPVYHQWMQDPKLQEETASEPLTLEEEYQMQQEWAEDKQKCTFILLDPLFPDSPGTGSHGGAMCGDINLFWNDDDESSCVEISVMLPESRSRRKGIGTEAAKLVMAYAAQFLGVTKFRAKIGLDNEPSKALFASLGYVEVKRVAVFNEVWFELAADESMCSTALRIGTYDTKQSTTAAAVGAANDTQ